MITIISLNLLHSMVFTEIHHTRLPQTVLQIYFFLFLTQLLSPPNDAANIMMLFTDGEATAGPVTHWPTIRDHFTERNKVSFENNNLFKAFFLKDRLS